MSVLYDEFFSWQRDWKRSSSTLSLDEASDLQAVVDRALAARLHSIEGNKALWKDLTYSFNGTYALANVVDKNFSSSLIIQEPRTMEIMHCCVFGYLTKNSSFLISPSKSVCFRSHIKHSSQCFITISKTSKCVKNIPLRVVFLTLFSVFDMWWNTVSCLMY